MAFHPHHHSPYSVPYQISYHPPYYHPFPAQFDPSVSLANPYIYDPNHVKHRRRTTPEQLKVLEETFKTDPKPSPALRRQLSAQLGMSPRVLQVWFQNRRMKVKRLAKKQSAAEEQRAASESGEQDDADLEEKSPASDAGPSTSAHPASSASTPDAETPAAEHSPPSPAPSSKSHPSPPPDLNHRRVSLPAVNSPPTGSPTNFDTLVDPLSRRRSLASLHRLESHPNISVIAASNSHHMPGRPSFTPIVPPSLPPSFRSFHHHSPSAPLSSRLSVHPHMHHGHPNPQHRPASFHVIPAEAHQHLSGSLSAPTPFTPSLLHQPYSFPPRPVPNPGPGPLPAADFSFGTPAYSAHLVREDDASSEYTDNALSPGPGMGYRSRFGSFASIAESESGCSGSVFSGEWDQQTQQQQQQMAHDERRPSWTGEVAEMFQGLEVSSGTPNEQRSMWDTPQEYHAGEETTPPAAPGPSPSYQIPTHQPQPRRPPLPISQTSELAFALADKTAAQNANSQQSPGGSGEGGSPTSMSSARTTTVALSPQVQQTAQTQDAPTTQPQQPQGSSHIPQSYHPQQPQTCSPASSDEMQALAAASYVEHHPGMMGGVAGMGMGMGGMDVGGMGYFGVGGVMGGMDVGVGQVQVEGYPGMF